MFGVFTVEWIHTTHSVPDSCALAIRTPHGTVVHTGDFKLDQTPIHGTPPEFGRFAQLGEEGVLLLLGNPTERRNRGHDRQRTFSGPRIGTDHRRRTPDA